MPFQSNINENGSANFLDNLFIRKMPFFLSLKQIENICVQPKEREITDKMKYYLRTETQYEQMVCKYYKIFHGKTKAACNGQTFNIKR